MGEKTRIALGVVAAAAVVIQFFPPERTNPPSDPAASFEAVVKPPPRVAAIIARSCQDCHSNRTVWPWYSRVAPASWLVADDVIEARRKFNFSAWSRLSPERAQEVLGNMCDEVKAGDMPLWQYRLMHWSARLSADDVKAVCTLSPRVQ
jgi:hypothetical protein